MSGESEIVNNTGGDLSSYVKDNHIPLNGNNYNEIDGLVFSELSYMRFEDCDWSSEYADGKITIKEFANKLLENSSLSDDEKTFLRNLSKSDRYKNLEVSDMAALNGNTYWDGQKTTLRLDDGQWAGVTIKLDDDTAVVANRGTNGTSLGWNEDLELAYDSDGTAAQKAARDYLMNTKAGKIIDVGHSKGGNDAETGYAMADEATRRKVIRVDTYDCPGNNDDIKEKYADSYTELERKQHNHYPENSIVGMLLNDHPGDNNDFCKTDTTNHRGDGTLFGEHDPFSWKIDSENNSFDEGTQSDISKTINNIMDRAIDNMGPEGRYLMVKVLEQIGITSLLDSGLDGLSKAIRIIAGLKSLSIFEKALILDFLYQVLKETIKEIGDISNKENDNEKGKSPSRSIIDNTSESGRSIYRVDLLGLRKDVAECRNISTSIKQQRKSILET